MSEEEINRINNLTKILFNAKMVNAIEKGNVKLSPIGEEYFAREEFIEFSKDADFTIVEARIESVWGPWNDGKDLGNDGGLRIAWGSSLLPKNLENISKN